MNNNSNNVGKNEEQIVFCRGCNESFVKIYLFPIIMKKYVD